MSEPSDRHQAERVTAAGLAVLQPVRARLSASGLVMRLPTGQ
jgi:hypothetical protein